MKWYEILVWLIYACIYKYSLYLGSPALPHSRINFPFPQLIGYAVAMTVYVLPFYRLAGPWLLRRRRYILLFFATLVYFFFVPKWVNWGISYLFQATHREGTLAIFYRQEFLWYDATLAGRGLKMGETLTDMLAFLSVMFMRWAFENERQRHALEKDNLTLQLETLKAQLHPHFLFNTLNSIYGMSLTGAKETPVFILRLSDMMRYVLYDCRESKVSLEKDIAFLGNYLEMEKKRYPEARIDIDVPATAPDGVVVPLLLIPFLENSFKHGSHRVTDTGFIRGGLMASGGELRFQLVNSMLEAAPVKTPYGGVGIDNVRRRLALYYPGRHDLKVSADGGIYSVNLKISLQPRSTVLSPMTRSSPSRYWNNTSCRPGG